MTKFDSDSIKNKIIERLNQDKNWQAITSNSAITALINSQAEASAEIARYAEYLFKESRWDTAQNESSILSMANMLGYQPKRKISATGKICLAVDKIIHSVGSTISMNDFINLDTVKSNNNATLTIPEGTALSINNVDYIIGQTASFPNGKKTVTDVSVIQGRIKTLHLDKPKIQSTYSKSKLNAYIYIPFYCSNVENADTINTSKFLKVKVNNEEYRIVENLLLSTSEDRDCELYNDLYSRNLFYLKFRSDNKSLNFVSNSFTGIDIEYIESKGASGNIDSLYKNCQLTLSDGTTLYGVNTTPLNNGKDEEDVVSIKKNAVSYYRDFYSIGTRENYEKAILKMEFSLTDKKIQPSKVKVFSDKSKTKTNVSFISSSLEDLSTSLSTGTETIEEQITSQLNKALTRLKSPQDVLNFIYPNYYYFGLKCSCKTNSDNTVSISSTIQSYIDSLWGVNSDYIDFDRDFLVSDILYNIRNSNDTLISSASIDAIEAVTQIDWKDISWEETEKGSSQKTHYCKMPFEFQTFFRSKSVQSEGQFFDLTKHSYALRIDIMFRCSNNVLTKKYNKTLFFKLKDNSNPDSIYFIRNSSGLWDDSLIDKNTLVNYQLPFQSSLLSDDDFTSLETKISNGLISQISDTELGSIKDFVLELDNTYNISKTKVSGYCGIAFDSLFRVLQVLSLYDSSLKNNADFTNINLATLQCGTDNTSFVHFKSVAAKYIDVYISLLVDNNTDIVLEDSDTSVNLLCMDTHDNYEQGLADLSEYKKNRFITVTSSFEE